jgi:tRNA 2-thiouridine synthesizing protein A
MSESVSDTTLDARGLKCPLPVLKARRALKEVPPGGILRVLATDPGAEKDFVHFCDTTGCLLLDRRLGRRRAAHHAAEADPRFSLALSPSPEGGREG